MSSEIVTTSALVKYQAIQLHVYVHSVLLNRYWYRTQVSRNWLSITKHIYIMSIYTEQQHLYSSLDSWFRVSLCIGPKFSPWSSPYIHVVQSTSTVQSPAFTMTGPMNSPNACALACTAHTGQDRNQRGGMWNSVISEHNLHNVCLGSLASGPSYTYSCGENFSTIDLALANLDAFLEASFRVLHSKITHWIHLITYL